MSVQDIRAKLSGLGFRLEPLDTFTLLQPAYWDHVALETPTFILNVGANDMIYDEAIDLLSQNGFVVDMRGETMGGVVYVVRVVK